MGMEDRSDCCNARVAKIKVKDKDNKDKNKLLCLKCKKEIEIDMVHPIAVKATVKLQLQNK